MKIEIKPFANRVRFTPVNVSLPLKKGLQDSGPARGGRERGGGRENVLKTVAA